MNYIITEPETDDHKKGHKFPFVASELLNCDINKINELFTLTEAEMGKRDRKFSEVSNADSDMILSAEDHLNAFSNKGEEGVNKEQEKEHSEEEKVEEAKEVPKGQAEPSNEEQTNMNKSINDLINTEVLDEQPHHESEHTDKQKNRIELLDYFLSFIETDKELNYVLAGYFSKYLNLLLNKFPHKIIGYIYIERPEIIDKLLQHCDKKSISEILPKLVLVENYLGGEKGENKATSLSISVEKSNTSNAFTNLNSPLSQNFDAICAIRKEILTKLFSKLTLTEKDPEIISNISNVCIETIENRTVLELILTDKPLLEHLITQLALNLKDKSNSTGTESTNTDFYDVNFNYSEILNVFINIIRYSQVENLKCPTYKNTGEDIVNSEQVIENTPLGECVIIHLEKVLANFLPDQDDTTEDTTSTTTSKTLNGTFGYTFKPLGSRRVKLVELVYLLLNYFKNVSSGLDRILINSSFLKYLLHFFFQYEWNNHYQLNFETLFKHLLTHINNHPEISKYLFEDLNILDIFITKGSPCNSSDENDNGFSFNSNRKINHGYFAILIELCYKISQMDVSSNSSFKESYFTPEWHSFVQEKVCYWKKLFERKLCVPETNIPHDEIEEDVQTKEDSKVEEESKVEAENNPFPKKETIFTQDNEDWFNPKSADENYNNDNMLEDINNFEFVDDNKSPIVHRKSSKDNMLLQDSE